MPSYQVTDSSTYGRQGHYGQTNMAYNGHGMEMNEKNRYDKPPAYNTGGYSTDGTSSRKENGHSRNNSVHHVTKDVSNDDDDEQYDRGHWGSKAEFILSCIGYSVGIGNVWRFPYLAYKNGGGAFLIPYFILLILVGKPFYYMETALGQFSRLSPLQVWRCAPIATGVGVGMLVISLIVAIYYNVVMAYSIIYVGASFRGITEEVPWSYCGEWWGADENCVIRTNLTDAQKAEMRKPPCFPTSNGNCSNLQSSSEQFWEKYVLNINEGLVQFGDIGGFQYHLPLALLLSWTVVFLCLCKGVKSSGKVVYFTATFPYVVLIALLIRGLTLDGAVDGIVYLFTNEVHRVYTYPECFTVWRQAAEQMFFSLGISWGGLIMFGSYNKFNNKINIDASVVSSLDFITSIISSCVVFSVLGYLAKISDLPIDDVTKGGQGLAFIAYPEALARLPLAWLWSVLFFLMLFFLGLDSEFALLETVLTALYDGVPKMRKHKVKVTGIACVACFLVGLPCVADGGQYIFNLMDTYGAGFAVVWIAIWEVISLMWIYGFKNFSKDLALMIGSEPSWFWKICWGFVTPVLLLAVFIPSCINFELPKYNGQVEYPAWAHMIGWILVGISAVQVPLWAAIMSIVYLARGKIGHVVKPTSRWGPGDPGVRKAIFNEQNGIAPISAYDNQAISAYDL